MSGPGVLEMMAVVYNSPTTITTPYGAYTEMISREAFRNVLKRKDGLKRTLALRDHDQSLLLGRASSSTLRLTNTPAGILASIRLPDTELGRETATLVDRRDLAGGSFSFVAAKDAWHESDKGPVRVIEEVAELWDVSVCGWPQYEATSAWIWNNTRSMATQLKRHELSARAQPPVAQFRGRPTMPPLELWRWLRTHRRPARAGCGHAAA